MGTTEIQLKFLVLVEGWDEYALIPQFVTARALPTFQVFCYDGITNLPKYLRTLQKIPGYSDATGIAIIQDADANPAGTLQSIRDSLNKAGMPVPSAELTPIAGPPRVCIMLSPGLGQTGEFEDACLASIANDPVLPSVKEFISSVEGIRGSPILKRSKANVQAFLGARDYPLRRLADKPLAWNLIHPAFDGLEAVLRSVL